MARRKIVARNRSARTSGERSGNKSIVLFSDGTGNSSAKLFKTNVWRMYEAVDLGPSPRGKRDQIAYYDNGVGTTSFRPLRMLQGAFGWGLKRNVLEIYRYACRNYTKGPGQTPGANPKGKGDHFYGFGFSRGAFTMRLAMDLIASEGIPAFDNERELLRKTKLAYRHYIGGGAGFGWKALPTQAWRLARNAIGAAWRKARGIPAYNPADNYQPVVKFIGVWDTVAAYGGPVVEITRAIDMFVYPLSMPSYSLNPRVLRARHALALDDERDSFQPLLWDEVNEARLVKAGEVDRHRLEQVWFTGMHADVGGGYPDESLSYVSLLWMIDEAEKAGLRTLDVITERYLALANSFGPIHDSREGLASYYRYHPRKIAALLDPPESGTLSLRDPSIRDGDRKERGLLLDVKVHESVIARIANGTDDYAPIVLPQRFSIVPPGPTSEAQPQAVSGAPPGCRRAKLHAMSHAVLDPLFRRRLARDGVVKRLGREIEQAWDLVWARRIVYFATVFATILLIMIPLGIGNWNIFAGQDDKVSALMMPTDDRNWFGNLIRLPTAFLPEFTRPWIEGLARNPVKPILLVVLILILNRLGSWFDRKLRDRAGQAWQRALGPYRKPAPMPRSPVESLRRSSTYQLPLKIFKWYVLPSLIGVGILAMLAWVALAIGTQSALPSLEAGNSLCAPSRTTDTSGAAYVDFQTDQLCNRTGMLVEADHLYTITFEVGESWSDGRRGTTPLGATALDVGWAGVLGIPLRRVVNARYLQPLAEVRRGDQVEIYALELEQVEGGAARYRASFRSRQAGELFLFSNDAVLPLPPAADADGGGGSGLGVEYFYVSGAGRNAGNACVTVQAEQVLTMAPPPAGSLCAKLVAPAAPPAATAGPPD
jgi:uncharacterized protein (DUF2235 family)